VEDGDGEVASATYGTGGAGSYEAWWWPDVVLRDGEYVVTAFDGSASVATTFAGAAGPYLPLPAAELAPDASRIDWPDVPGAASYACRVHASGALQLELVSREAGCDLSTLPPGGYAASVVAFSADLVALGESAGPRPSLPERFDVSEARLAFVRPADGAALIVHAAGGAVDSTIPPRGLAVWLSIAAADGSPTATAWDVAVVGPSLPPEAPLEFTYHANFPRQMVWSYDVPAVPGTYSLVATSGSSAVSVPFTVGAPDPLAFVLDAAASPRAGGSADVTWTPVGGARAYLVDVWDRAAGAPAASMWIPSPPARFPTESFAPGVEYDVYVAATDADMSGATLPDGFAVSLYPFLPAGFVAE
jgi:hypothetical protein